MFRVMGLYHTIVKYRLLIRKYIGFYKKIEVAFLNYNLFTQPSFFPSFKFILILSLFIE